MAVVDVAYGLVGHCRKPRARGGRPKYRCTNASRTDGRLERVVGGPAPYAGRDILENVESTPEPVLHFIPRPRTTMMIPALAIWMIQGAGRDCPSPRSPMNRSHEGPQPARPHDVNSTGNLRTWVEGRGIRCGAAAMLADRQTRIRARRWLRRRAMVDAEIELGTPCPHAVRYRCATPALETLDPRRGRRGVR